MITEFYTALGQYLSYRIALGQQQSDYDLYLAVSSDIYQTFFLKQISSEAEIFWYNDALTPGPSPRGRGEKTTGVACLPSPSGRGAGGEGDG